MRQFELCSSSSVAAFSVEYRLCMRETTVPLDNVLKVNVYIQNLIGIHFGVSRSPSTQNVTLAYYSLAGSQAQTSVCGVPVDLFPV